MIPNWSKMSMSDPPNHLGSIWYHSGPLEVPYSPNQFLGWDFFWPFLTANRLLYYHSHDLCKILHIWNTRYSQLSTECSAVCFSKMKNCKQIISRCYYHQGYVKTHIIFNKSGMHFLWQTEYLIRTNYMQQLVSKNCLQVTVWMLMVLIYWSDN